MKIVTNEKLVKRNARIGQIASLIGLLVLGGGMYVSFSMPQQVGISLTALLVGFLLSQIGIYFGNRWGRRPRPDELLNQSLKGLDNKWSLYHYASPASHLLVGPSGVWVVLPRHQRGIITYRKGRWVQKVAKPSLLKRAGEAYLRMFAQEGLGRPDLEVDAEIDAVRKFLKAKLPEDANPPIHAALVFTHPTTQVELDENELPPTETVHISKFKDVVRKTIKAHPLPVEKVKVVEAALEADNQLVTSKT